MALIISWWGGNLRRRGRRVSGHYWAPETSKCIHRPAAKQQLHKHISSNLQYFGNSQQYTIHLYLKTLIDRKALVMMVKQQTAVGHFENTDSTHKKVKMFRCWDEVQFSDSLMKCHQFVLKYFLLLGWSMKSFKISSFILKLVLGINYLPYLDSFNATHTSYRVFYTKIKIRLIIAHY